MVFWSLPTRPRPTTSSSTADSAPPTAADLRPSQRCDGALEPSAASSDETWKKADTDKAHSVSRGEVRAQKKRKGVEKDGGRGRGPSFTLPPDKGGPAPAKKKRQRPPKKSKFPDMIEQEQLPRRKSKPKPREPDTPARRVRRLEINEELVRHARCKRLAEATATLATAKAECLANDYTYTIAINAHVRCGDDAGAEALLARMKALRLRPGVVAYTTVLRGLCAPDKLKLRRADALLDEMDSARVPHNVRSANTYLRGCLHAGDADRAAACLARMRRAWRVAPDASSLEMTATLLCQALRVGAATAVRRQLQEGASASGSGARNGSRNGHGGHVGRDGDSGGGGDHSGEGGSAGGTEWSAVAAAALAAARAAALLGRRLDCEHALTEAEEALDADERCERYNGNGDGDYGGGGSDNEAGGDEGGGDADNSGADDDDGGGGNGGGNGGGGGGGGGGNVRGRGGKGGGAASGTGTSAVGGGKRPWRESEARAASLRLFVAHRRQTLRAEVEMLRGFLRSSRFGEIDLPAEQLRLLSFSTDGDGGGETGGGYGSGGNKKDGGRNKLSKKTKSESAGAGADSVSLTMHHVLSRKFGMAEPGTTAGDAAANILAGILSARDTDEGKLGGGGGGGGSGGGDGSKDDNSDGGGKLKGEGKGGSCAAARINFARLFAGAGGVGLALPVKLEICSGDGAWIIEQAAADAGAARWCAMDVRHDRCYAAWARSVFRGVGNLAVVAGDAAAVLADRVPAAAFDCVCINYPEPPQQGGSSSGGGGGVGDSQSAGAAATAAVALPRSDAAHLLTADFFRSVRRVLRPGGSCTIVTDNLWYGRLLLGVLSRLLPSGVFAAAAVAGRAAQATDFATGLSLYAGTPPPEACGAPKPAVSSYFDRLKVAEKDRRGQRATPFFLCVRRPLVGGVPSSSVGGHGKNKIKHQKKDKCAAGAAAAGAAGAAVPVPVPVADVEPKAAVAVAAAPAAGEAEAQRTKRPKL